MKSRKILAGATVALLVAGAFALSAPAAYADDTITDPTTPATEEVTTTPEEGPLPAEEVAPEAPAAEAPAPVIPEALQVPAEAPAAPVQEAVVEEDATPYILVAWALPGDVSDPIWPQQIKTSLDLATPSLDALDGSLGTCGVDYQVDLYYDNEVTQSLIAGGVLRSPNNPPEALAYVLDGQNPWKYVDNEDCAPPVTNQCTEQPGVTVSNLNPWAEYDVRTSGHYEYTTDGLHVWTTDNSSQAKVSLATAASFALKNTGTLDLDWTGSTPPPGINLFVNFGADGNGTLVYESVYGQDLWLTNGSSAAVKANAPVNGGGNGSQWHGTIDQWLTKYPDATVTGLAFSLGSGVLGDGVIKSITAGCTTYTFTHEEVVVTPPTPVNLEGPSIVDVCGEENDGGHLPADSEGVTYAWQDPDSWDNWNVVATIAEGYAVDDAAGYVEQEDGTYVLTVPTPEFTNVPCDEETQTPTPTPTPTTTPTTTPAPVPSSTPAASKLAVTGGNGIDPTIPAVGLLALLGGIIVLGIRRIRATR